MAQSIFVAAKQGEELAGIISGFENSGYAVVVANEGEQALNLLKKIKVPLAIVLSSSLEIISTLDICKDLKTMKRFFKIPIFIMMDSKKFEPKTYTGLNIKEFIEKPVSSMSIIRTLKDLIADRKQTKGSGLDMPKWQMVFVGIILGSFVVVVGYFIILPMIAGLK